MAAELTSSQRKLADEVTAAITDLAPQDLDGDSIVRMLYASKAGREALVAAGVEATLALIGELWAVAWRTHSAYRSTPEPETPEKAT